MKKLFLILFIPLYSLFLPPAASGVTPYIIGPDVKIINNNIVVRTSIADIADFEQIVKSSIGKEIIFTAELMRVWDFWPDEFIVSKKIRKIVKYDNLRDQYRTSWRDGITRTDNIFTEFNTMKNWILSEDSISIANIKELEPGSYYIRFVVESKSREKIPLIGFLMYLVPEVEMSLAKESQSFILGIDK
ncbi:MAG: DUF4390 domain-containing protein [Nitrospirae bacterium]|nr:DUF4390 domain-containing protein [Nitrospirota bacterium]